MVKTSLLSVLFSKTTRKDWSWPLVGIFVVPLCVNLVLGVPYQILVDRDFQLNAVPISARIVAARDVYTKQGWTKEYEHRYFANGKRRSVWLGQPKGVKVGDIVEIVCAPTFPWRAQRVVEKEPWNHNLWWRLSVSWTLALLLGSVWLSGVFRFGRGSANDGG